MLSIWQKFCSRKIVYKSVSPCLDISKQFPVNSEWGNWMLLEVHVFINFSSFYFINVLETCTAKENTNTWTPEFKLHPKQQFWNMVTAPLLPMTWWSNIAWHKGIKGHILQQCQRRAVSIQGPPQCNYSTFINRMIPIFQVTVSLKSYWCSWQWQALSYHHS